MRVHVTGGLGYVGSRLCPHLLSLGHEVRALDLGLYGDAGMRALETSPDWADWRNRFEWSQGDIRSPKSVTDAVAGVDAVVHLAAISNDPTGEVDAQLTRQVNFDAIGLLVALAKQAGVSRFINASSSSVFGMRDEEDIVESLEPAPITTYSTNKMLSEWILLAARGPGFVTTNIRPATICGFSPRQRFDLTVNKLTVDAVRKGVITVHGGQQRRPNVSMQDVIHLYARLLEIDAAAIDGRTFNFGFENLRIIDLAKGIQKRLADLDVRIDVTELHDQRDYHISSDALVRATGYTPVGSIGSAVDELREKLDAGHFPDPDSEEHHNMKSMKLDRNASAYAWLADPTSRARS
jgi:nucleoside-diphosphate-sugar epimerase